MNQIKIGKFIAERRKKANLTQMQLAEKLNIKPTDAMLENERTSLVNMYKTLYMEQQGLDEATALSTAEEFVKNLGDVYIYENVLFDLVKVELFRKRMECAIFLEIAKSVG